MTTTKHTNIMATIEERAAANLAGSLDFCRTFFRGGFPCDNCDEDSRADCPLCNGTGTHQGEDPTLSFSMRARHAASEVDNALGEVANVIAAARVVEECSKRGVARLDCIAPDAWALVAELEALAPALARAAAILEHVDALCAEVEGNDPRMQQRQAILAVVRADIARREAARANDDDEREQANAAE